MKTLSQLKIRTEKLARLYANERHAAVEFLLELAQFDRDQIWRKLGHAHLFGFLRRELGMSKSSTYYRIKGAQLLREYPAIEEPFRDGRLCFSVVVELAKVITQDNWREVLPRFYGLSKREAQQLEAALAPRMHP